MKANLLGAILYHESLFTHLRSIQDSIRLAYSRSQILLTRALLCPLPESITNVLPGFP